MDTWEIVDSERAAFADLTDTLTDEQWNKTSLCTAWKVRDVVAHVNEGASLTGAQAVLGLMKYGFRLNTMLEREAIKDGAAPPATLSKALHDAVGKRQKPPGVKAEGMLLDTVVHQQDVRRPLDLPRQVPPETLTIALDELVKQKSGLLPAKKRVDGLKLRATDVAWEHGEGAEVSGTGEALLMALAGRSSALADLSGPGLDTLRSRLAG